MGCLQRRHPFLRSRLKINPTQADSYMMEEDFTLRLPIRELSRKRDIHQNFWYEEWRRREKEPVIIGQPLMEFWLLQVESSEIPLFLPMYVTNMFICRIRMI